MPMTQVFLLKGKSREYLQAISDRLHQALVDAFEVPPDDRFQIIHQREPEEFVFDRHYMGGPRSDDFVLFCVTAGKLRSTATKQAFYKKLVQLLSQSPGMRPEDVMVVINTTQTDEWSFSEGNPSRQS